jgi:hypothetical protein
MLLRRVMTELDDEVWENPVDVLHRRLVSHLQTGVPEDAHSQGQRGMKAVSVDINDEGTTPTHA